MNIVFEVKSRWRNTPYPIAVRALFAQGAEKHQLENIAPIPLAGISRQKIRHFGEIDLQLVSNDLTEKIIWPKTAVKIQSRPVVGSYTVRNIHLIDYHSISCAKELCWLTQAELLIACSRYIGLSSKEHATLCGMSPMTAAKHAENFRRKIRPMRLSGYLLGQILISYDALYCLMNMKNPHPYLVDLPLKQAL